MNIELSNEVLADVYANCNTAGRQVIKTELGDKLSEILPVTTRVKTFEDACEELGKDHEAVKAYRDIEWKLGKGNVDILAYLKLRIITTALNEGWIPQFTENEYRYYAWYNLYTKEEIDDMSDEKKEEIGLLLWGGGAGYGSHCGLACANSYNAWSISYAIFGSRLAFKSAELAKYAAKQFIDIYADFCFIPVTKENE